MDPDSPDSPDSPVSRVERTFWTVWNYITGAVNRFFRPELSDQPSAVHSGHSESDPDGQEVSEHPPVSTASLLTSSQPGVAWELGTTEIDLGPEEESARLSGGTESKAPTEGEDKREEEIGPTGNDDAGQLDCKTTRDQKDKEVDNREGKVDTYGQSQTPDNDEEEEDENLTERGMNEDLEVGRMASAGEESPAMTPEDQQIVSQTVREIQETEEMFHVAEQHLKAEEAAMTDQNPEHLEALQQTMAQTDVESADAVSQLLSENENGDHEMEKQFETQCLVCEQLSEDEADSGLSSPNRELNMTIRKGSNVSEDGGHEDVMTDRSQEETLDDQQKVSDVKEDMLSGEIKWCLMSDLSPTEVQTAASETEVEDTDAVSRLVSENKHSNDEVEKHTEHQHLVCEELSEAHTYDKAGSVGHEDVMADRSGSDEVEEEEQKVSESTRKIQVKEEILSDEQVLEDSEITMWRMTDLSPAEEHNMHIEEMQTTVAETEVKAEVSENELDHDEVKKTFEYQRSVNDQRGSGLIFEMTVDAGHKHAMKSTSKSDEIEEERERVTEAAGNQTTNVQQEQEEDIKLAEVNNRDLVTKHVEGDEEVQQRAEKEDVVKDHEMQTTTRETNTVTEEKYLTDISVEGRLFVKDEEEEEDGIVSSESGGDTACGIPSGTMKSKGETGQEICKEFKNTPLGIYEGQELNSPTCEETQEGVPEDNNEPGPDENTTQWFLEEGDYKETHATLLPEEVESAQPESLLNSGSGGDFSLKEEEQASTAEKQTRTHTNTGLLETEKQIVEPVEGPGDFSEEEEVRLVQNLKTTWTEHSEEAFGTDRIETELQGRTGELLGDSESDDGVSEIRNAAEDGQKSTGAVAAVDVLVSFTDTSLKLLESEREKMTETSFSQEAGAAVGSEYESSKPPRLEDSAGLGVLKQADTTERNLPSGTGMEEAGAEAVENESLSLDVAPTTLETKQQASHEGFEMLTDIGEAEDFLLTRSKPKVWTEAEQSHAGRRCQDFIDEEILDLWMEAASYQDEQTHVNVETSQTEEDKEKLLELISETSVNETETCLSTTESGLLDQSVSEQEGDLRETSSGTFQICNDKMFTELLTQQPNYESQEATERGRSHLTEKESISETGFHPDSGLQSSEAGYKSQEKMGQEGDVPSSVQIEEEKEKLEELITGESGLVSVTGMFSSTAESGLLDQSVSEQEGDLRETSSGAFQIHNDMLFTELSMPQPNYDSQEATETAQSATTEEIMFHMDSGLQSSEDGYKEGDIQSSVQTEKVKGKLEELISGESGLVRVMGMSSSTAESGLLDRPVRDTTQELNFDSQEATEKGQSVTAENETECRIRAPEAGLQESDQSQQRQGEEGDESAESETGSQKGMSADDTDEEKTKGEDALLEATVSDSYDEIKHPQSRCGSDASIQEETMLTESQNDSGTEGEEEFMFSSLNTPQANTWSEDTYDSIPKLIRPETAEEPATHPDLPIEMNVTVLDFTAQKSRIAVKNPNVRPPQNPRSLLHMPSEDPTPTTHPPVKAPMGVSFGGVGMGIKLPGLGAGFPVLKKTRVVAEDKSAEESETKPEEKSDSTKHRPKWMPPTHQGFGNPFMSELKTKLRKSTEE